MVIEFNKWFFILWTATHLYRPGDVSDKKDLLHERARDLHPLHVSVTEINHNANDNNK